MEIWGCQNPQTDEPIDMKFDVGDYVDNITLHAKIPRDHTSWGVLAYG